MGRKIFLTLFVGLFLAIGMVYADQYRDLAKTDIDEQFKIGEPNRIGGHWIIKDDEPRLVKIAEISSSPKQAKSDSNIVFFTAENGWYDATMTTEKWDTVDVALMEFKWHVEDTIRAAPGDTVVPCTGDSAWWCGDHNIGTYGGYSDHWYQTLTSPSIILPAADSIFLTYNHYLRCEDQLDSLYSWDGYQVRISTSTPDTFKEIKPWHADSAYYYGLGVGGEYDSLYAMEHHNETGGGFSQDTSAACEGKVFNLSAYAGETIKFLILFVSDPYVSTGEDDSWFGLMVDDIYVTQYVAHVPTVLFKETCEAVDMPHKMIPGTKPLEPSNWTFSGFNHTPGGNFSALDGDPNNDTYYPEMEEDLISPKISYDNLPANLGDLWFDYWFMGYVDDPNVFPFVDYTYTDVRMDGGAWINIGVINGQGAGAFDPDVGNNWTYTGDHLVTWARDLRPLLDTTQYVWDTLEVKIHWHSDSDVVGGNAKAFKVDDVAVYGRVGLEYDIGVSAVKLPSPNSNDVRLVIDSVAVTNYGFAAASSGGYLVRWVVLDTAGTQVYGPATIVSSYPTIPAFSTAMMPCDTSVAKFTFTQEMAYFFKFYTTHTQGDDDLSNDTLRTEYTKAFHYPYVYNYPAGVGELRYHDNFFYNWPSAYGWILEDGEVAAVRFEPEDRFDPFDIAFGEPHIVGDGGTYDLIVWELGISDDEPGDTVLVVPFSTNVDSFIMPYLIRLDTLDAMISWTEGFWMGVRNPNPLGTDSLWLALEVPDADPPMNGTWDHSYAYMDTGNGYKEWVNARDDFGDFIFSSFIRWQTVDPVAMPSLSGPPKNASGNLYLDWDDVSQAYGYAIFRGTNLDSPFTRLDTALVSNYTDMNVVGDVDTSYFYFFHTVHDSAGHPAGIYDKQSPAIGEFDRSLINAK